MANILQNSHDIATNVNLVQYLELTFNRCFYVVVRPSFATFSVCGRTCVFAVDKI